MGKKKKKKKKKEEAKSQFSDKFTLERLMLIVVSVLLIVAVGYIAISSLTRSDTDETTSVTSGDVQETKEFTEDESGGGEEAVSEGGEGMVTPTPRRLELKPTFTPAESISEDDPRSILDRNIPDGTSSFDEAEWYVYDTENATYELKDGQLAGVDHEPEEKKTYYSEYRQYESGNVYAEITATNGDCTGKDSVGIVIRIDAETLGGYTFEVACDGSYRLRSLRSSGAKGTLINWTPSDAINAGPFAINRLGLWGYMGKFHLFVNDQHIDEFFDNNYLDAYGGFAVYVRASQTFDLSATFDDFAFWHIPFIP